MRETKENDEESHEFNRSFDDVLIVVTNQLRELCSKKKKIFIFCNYY